MTEENKQVETTQPETVEKEYSPIEQKAIEQGWRPKEEFDGDEHEFIDAPEFVRRGELFAKIESQSKELKGVRHALDMLKQHHSKTHEAAYNKALRDLQSQKKAAALDGDREREFVLEEKIDELKDEKKQIDAQFEQIEVPAVQQVDPAFSVWQENNSWYGKDKAMTSFADELGRELRAEVLAGVKTRAEVLAQITKEVKQEFKHKFSNEKTRRPAAVESPSRGGRQGKADDFVMSDDERAIMRKFVNSGIITEEQYIKDLKAQKES